MPADEARHIGHVTQEAFASDLRERGAHRLRHAVLPHLDDLDTVLGALPQGRAGVRIHALNALGGFLAIDGPIGMIAARVLGTDSRPVRAVLFDKTAEANWALAWHLDRTICVRDRVDMPGFGPWTVKDGLQHVEPPFRIIENMVTLRVHLDPVPETNAPLLVVPGSHRLGRISVDRIKAVADQLDPDMCTAEAGDVWIYATAIVHGSRAAECPARRRVLQVDFSSDKLPPPLQWLGV